MVSYISFFDDDTVDLKIPNKKGSFNIAACNRRGYNAVSTLFVNECRNVSLTEIYTIVTGYSRANPTKHQIESIKKFLEKLKSIKVCIDLIQKVTNRVIKDKQTFFDDGILKDHSDKIKKAGREDNMLHFLKVEIVIENGKVFTNIQIVGEPILLTIAMEYIGLQEWNATDKAISMTIF